MMQKKKILAAFICLSLFFSTAGFISMGAADELMKKTDLSTGQFIKSTPVKEVIEDLNKGINVTANDITATISNGDGVLYQGERESLQSGDPFAEDKYNINQEELEDLVKKGHSIADIYRADEIGNRLNEDPKILLEKKKSKNQDWSQVEEELLKERADKFLNKLKEKHPQEFQQLQSEGLSVEEQFTLLAMYDKQVVPSFQQLIDTYKKSGEAGLKNIFKNPKFYGKVSKEKMDKHGLTAEDVEGLSDEMIDRMEMISRKANVPVKQLIKGYREKAK